MFFGMDPLYIAGVYLAVLAAIKFSLFETVSLIADLQERYEREQERRRQRHNRLNGRRKNR